MNAPDPRELERRTNLLTDLTRRLNDAYNAAHDDAYSPPGGGIEGGSRSDHPSDPVGDRWDTDGPTPDEIGRALAYADAAVEQARQAIASALYGPLNRWRPNNDRTSHRQADIGRPGRHHQDEPGHVLLGTGPCPHGDGDARCGRCANAELQAAREAQQRRRDRGAA